jgi:hypothetical protein
LAKWQSGYHEIFETTCASGVNRVRTTIDVPQEDTMKTDAKDKQKKLKLKKISLVRLDQVVGGQRPKTTWSQCTSNCTYCQ